MSGGVQKINYLNKVVRPKKWCGAKIERLGDGFWGQMVWDNNSIS
jgi:hypothetical protein